MSSLQQFWKDIGVALGLPHSSLNFLEVFAALLIIYLLYVVFSIGILYLAFSFVNKKITWAQAFATVIIRDIIFLPLSFFAFGIGYILAFSIWIGSLKYRFNLGWGRALHIALIAALLPTALTIIILVFFFASIVFIAKVMG